jgi:opacity protein-like surface antigen
MKRIALLFVLFVSAAASAQLASVPMTVGIPLTAPRQYYVCNNSCLVTPPPPSAGYEFCIMGDNNGSFAITLAGLGSGAMYESPDRNGYGTAGTGKLVSAGNVGDKVCIIGRDATHYLTIAFAGTWTLQ